MAINNQHGFFAGTRLSHVTLRKHFVKLDVD
jgi:hypothetical protein